MRLFFRLFPAFAPGFLFFHATHTIPLTSYSVEAILILWHWEVEYTGEFNAWWDGLTGEEQESVAAYVTLLEQRGPSLRHPYSSAVLASKHGHMRELRPQHAGRPYRVLYAFDPRRTALLLLGGDKTGNDRWYEENVPKADALCDEHLKALIREGKL